MSSKALNSRQARWAELLADFNFVICYRPGRHNPLADALTRKPDELHSQNSTKKSQRFQQLLRDNQIDEFFRDNKLRLNTQQETTINLIDISSISPSIGIVDQALAANRNALSLQALRKKAASPTPGKFLLSNGLLLFDERLLVPDTDSIRTLLIREAHDQVSTA
ncbi:hypothetical protein K3495_g17247, partial [Podosphaera aphanis]